MRGRLQDIRREIFDEIFCLAIERAKNQFLHITSRPSVLTLFSFFKFSGSKDTYCFEHLVESPRVTLGEKIELKDKEKKNVHNIRQNY